MSVRTDFLLGDESEFLVFPRDYLGWIFNAIFNG